MKPRSMLWSKESRAECHTIRIALNLADLQIKTSQAQPNDIELYTDRATGQRSYDHLIPGSHGHHRLSMNFLKTSNHNTWHLFLRLDEIDITPALELSATPQHPRQCIARPWTLVFDRYGLLASQHVIKFKHPLCSQLFSRPVELDLSALKLGNRPRALGFV